MEKMKVKNFQTLSEEELENKVRRFYEKTSAKLIGRSTKSVSFMHYSVEFDKTYRYATITSGAGPNWQTLMKIRICDF